MQIGSRHFDLAHKSYIMGILNVTPDSFSDGGSFVSPDDALYRTEQMVRQGASIIDVGGESTRPGYRMISDQEEIERVIPVVERIHSEFDVALSLDTYKYEVAREGIAAGADMINDIWGLRWDDRLAGLIAREGVACCLMHNRKKPCSDHFFAHFCEDMEASLSIAREAGIATDKIILDPGIGFGKTYEQNLWLLRELGRMKRWGLPILLGTSRKSVIGITLDLPVGEREEATIATTVLGRRQGASLFRVHDVEKNIRALKMTDAILEAGLPEDDPGRTD